jgi:TM2 domain-containing membrane protein YozV
MLCRKCGYHLGVVAKFCPSCGQTVDDTQTANNLPEGNWPMPYQAPGTSPAISAPPAPPVLAAMPASLINSDAYYLMLNGQQSGPYTVNQLKAMWQSGTVNAGTYYWQTGMGDWQPLVNIRPFLDAPAANPVASQIVVNQVNAPMPYQPVMAYSTKSRGVFIVLGFFFGCLGVHNFYAGYSGKGIAQLMITIFTGWIFGIGLFITGVWALIEIIAVNTDAHGLRMT